MEPSPASMFGHLDGILSASFVKFMDCPSCKAKNLDDMRFCGQCAYPLDPAADLVTRQVNRMLAERFSDRGLIEHEVSDHLITRFGLYLKIAAWVFAPAVTLLIVVIGIVGFLGIRTYDNAVGAIQGAADVATKSVQTKADRAAATIESAAKAAQTSAAEYNTKTATATQQLESRAKRVDARVTDVLASADENQRKLNVISEARRVNPNTTLGEFSSADVTPSRPGLGATSRGFSNERNRTDYHSFSSPDLPNRFLRRSRGC